MRIAAGLSIELHHAWPLGEVISAKFLSKYASSLRFLLQLSVAKWSAEGVWAEAKASPFVGISSAATKEADSDDVDVRGDVAARVQLSRCRVWLGLLLRLLGGLHGFFLSQAQDKVWGAFADLLTEGLGLDLGLHMRSEERLPIHRWGRAHRASTVSLSLLRATHLRMLSDLQVSLGLLRPQVLAVVGSSANFSTLLATALRDEAAVAALLQRASASALAQADIGSDIARARMQRSISCAAVEHALDVAREAASSLRLALDAAEREANKGWGVEKTAGRGYAYAAAGELQNVLGLIPDM